MAEFILDNELNSDTTNLVHLNSCVQLNNSGNTQYLGSFGTPVAAYNIARGLKLAVAYCPACLGKMAAQ